MSSSEKPRPVGPVIYFDLELEGIEFREDNVFSCLSGYDAVFTDCGRGALRLISEYAGEGEVLVPDYSCNAIAQGFQNMIMVPYPMGENFVPDPDVLERLITPRTRMISVNHFCGRLLDPEIIQGLLKLKERYGLILHEDATQSFLSAFQTFGDFCTTSLYKWFPVPAGAVLYSRTQLPETMKRPLRKRGEPPRAYAMILKTLLLRNEEGMDEDVRAISERWFDLFEEENVANAELPVASMTELDRFLLSCHSVSYCQKKRSENAAALARMLHYDRIRPVWERLPDERDALLCYPVFVTRGNGVQNGRGFRSLMEMRDALQHYLEEQEIYAPVYWRLKPPFGTFEESRRICNQILCLPMDQRYTIADMQRVADAVNHWQEMV